MSKSEFPIFVPYKTDWVFVVQIAGPLVGLGFFVLCTILF